MGRAGAATTTSHCRADVDDTAADSSNYGNDVDIMAPGVCIMSTLNAGGYGFDSGTWHGSAARRRGSCSAGGA